MPFQFGFLINPVSGGGLGMQVHHQLPEIMASFGFQKTEWKARLTQPINIKKQIKELLNGSAKVIAMGGDGTIGMVLEAISKLENGPEIGLIPLGTGNDLARSLGVWKVYHQKGLLASLKRLIKAPSTSFDLWDINGTKIMAAYFSMGIDGAILHDVDSMRKHSCVPKSTAFNKLLYLKYFLARTKYRIKNNVILSLEKQGRTTRISLKDHICCVIGNIASYAGGALPFIHNNFSDQKLEINLFHSLPDYLFHNLLARLMPSAIKRRKMAFQAESICISGLKGEFVQLDGENFSVDDSFDEISIRHANKVKILDLRMQPFNIF
jgi:diacylglycerol kinase family enzyme